MKRTILRISCVAVLVAAIAVAVFSCNKEKVVKDSITTETVNHFKSSLSGNYIIATAKEGDVEAHLLFDKSKFESLFQDVLSNHLGKNYIFDDISIWDENPADMNSTHALRITILNANDGMTQSIFLIIDKEKKGDKINYILKSGKQRVKKIECIGNCQKGDGCNINHAESGCTPCRYDGTCQSKVNWEVIDTEDGGFNWHDGLTVISTVATVIGIIIMLL